MKSIYWILLGFVLLSVNFVWACPESEICVGDRVNFDGSKVGTIREIFSNGKVKISRDGHSGYSYRNLAQLGYEITCSSEIPCRCSN